MNIGSIILNWFMNLSKKKQDMETMIRRVCKEEGLTSLMTEDLVATCKCESGLNPKAVNQNKDKSGKVLSTDYGICQWNTYYHIGKGKEIASIDEALNNPEKCVRVMAKFFKRGQADQWVCHLRGMQKKYLKAEIKTK